MRRYILKLGLLGLLALGVTACTVTVASEGPHPDVIIGAPRTVHVPPGHYPPPGECRVWYPDQPPPGPCRRLHAGHGAFVLHNGRAWDADYDWRTYARRHPRTVPKVIIKIKSR